MVIEYWAAGKQLSTVSQKWYEPLISISKEK